MSFSSLQIMMFYRPQPQPDVDGTDGLVEPVAPQPQPDVDGTDGLVELVAPQPQPDVDGTDGLVEPVAPEQPQPDVAILVGAADPQQLEPVCPDATDRALMYCAATGSVTTNCPVCPSSTTSYVPGISLEATKNNFWVSLAGIAILYETPVTLFILSSASYIPSVSPEFITSAVINTPCPVTTSAGSIDNPET
jgi:hypothetical protein